ncbi:hypothetical protein [Caniella muris]|nr:hypothetical protein [Caniella muris]
MARADRTDRRGAAKGFVSRWRDRGDEERIVTHLFGLYAKAVEGGNR